jgi:hypothetical protein
MKRSLQFAWNEGLLPGLVVAAFLIPLFVALGAHAEERSSGARWSEGPAWLLGKPAAPRAVAGETEAHEAGTSQLAFLQPPDSLETRSDWDVAKEILLWLGVVAVVGFFIVEVFIKPNLDEDEEEEPPPGKTFDAVGPPAGLSVPLF